MRGHPCIELSRFRGRKPISNSFFSLPRPSPTVRSRPRRRSLPGFVLSRFAADEAEILTIAVAPEWRRCGIGTLLLAPHLAGLAALRVNRLFLEVDVENIAARALYAGFGFEQVGERKAYYRTADDRLAAALVMRLELL